MAVTLGTSFVQPQRQVTAREPVTLVCLQCEPFWPELKEEEQKTYNGIVFSNELVTS